MPEYQNTRISDIDRGISEALRYYGGPLGEQVINAANFAQMFSPVTAIGNAMQGAKAAANPDRAPMERVQAGIESLAETASVAAPLGAAGILARAPRIPGRWGGAANDAAGALEEAIVGSGQLRDVAEGMTRRQFLQRGGAAGAMAAAGMKLPSEELLGRAATKAATDVSPLGEVVGVYRSGLQRARKLQELARKADEGMFDRQYASQKEFDEFADHVSDLYDNAYAESGRAIDEALVELRGVADKVDPAEVKDLPDQDLGTLEALLNQPRRRLEDLMEEAKMAPPDAQPDEADGALIDSWMEFLEDENIDALDRAVTEEIQRRTEAGSKHWNDVIPF